MVTSDQVFYCDGAYLLQGTPCLHPDDRGFRFGDGVFETIRIAGGAPYQWQAHGRRLQAGLEVLGMGGIEPVQLVAQLHAVVQELLARNGLVEGIARIMISRGRGSRGYLPAPGCVPTVVVETAALPERPGPMSLWLSRWRKFAADSLPHGGKLAAAGLNAALARMEAEAQACGEALQLSAEGYLCEASAANLFWLAQDVLYTPALATGALPGTTRAALLRLSPWSVQEGLYPLDRLRQAEAVLLTNAAMGCVPVAALAPMAWRWPGSAAIAAQLEHRLERDRC